MVLKLNFAIFLSVFFVIFISANALPKVDGSTKSEEKRRERRSVNRKSTDVISHEFCLSCLDGNDQRRKETLEEVHTYAELKNDPKASLPPSFTICSTAMTTYGPNPLFFTLLGKNRSQLFGARVRQLSKGLGRRFSYNNNYASVATMPVFPHQWVRSCVALNTISGSVQWVVDGILIEDNTLTGIKDSRNMPTDLSGNIVLGVNQWASKWAAYRSKVTNLNIFSSTLSVELMQQYTKGGECVAEGDYLAWREMQWSLYGQAVIETVDTEEPCLEEPFVSLYYAGFPAMETCMHFCENLGSRAPSVQTLPQWERLQTFLKEKLPNGISRRVWLAIDDKGTEGHWRDYYTQELVNITPPWIESEPNGGLSENCADMDFSYSLRWNDENCKRSGVGCTCSRNRPPRLKLQGLCHGSAVDAHYQPINDFTNFARLKLVGLYHSSIEYDLEVGKWKLTVAESKVNGSSKAALESFTLGRQNWTINGDVGCNTDGGEYTKELKMSGCVEGNFTCDDGQCVRIEQRCNQLPECRDESDEKNCQVLVLKEGYNRNLPPIRLDNGKKEMVNVSVSIDILKLVDIAEEEYSIDIQFAITLVWIENRATYQNLKNHTSLNALTNQEIEGLWLPKVVYENTDQKETTRLGDGNWEWETRVVVRRRGKGEMSGLDFVDETEIFKGTDNDLVMMQTYTHKFQCPFDLKKYPFDMQTCLINMAMGPLDRTSVNLMVGQLYMNESLDMPIFQITSWHLDQEIDANGRKGLSVVLVLKRKISSELMTTFFPTLLLIAITFATTFFKPFFFEAALSVNLTTMLVMTTIFISKMEGLPPTSDTKMIDIWLILCQMVPFAEVVLLTAMEYNREEEEGEQRTELISVKVKTSLQDEETISESNKVGLNKLKNVFSKCKAPNLKTIGEFVANIFLSNSDVIFCREKGATYFGDGLLRRLFWNCDSFLL